MLPTKREIALQIAIMHELYPDDTISEIARKLMYSPIFVINALDEGEVQNYFTRLKDEDKLVTTVPINYDTLMGHELGSENVRIQNEILSVITSANRDENDVESGTLDMWLVGVKPSEYELAIHVLLSQGFIHKYTLANPKDKESEYEFYTLNFNKGKEWGEKQFAELNEEEESDE